ncbi:signal peptidase I [Klebsiella pneumoniae]|nr:signal peptidase I [Klebsiella pneumoniae]
MLMSLRYLSPHRRGVLRVDKSLILHLVIISVLMHLFFSRFTLGHGLLHGCIPADYYMVDKYDKSYEIGDMINFTMDRDVRFIKPGEKVIKIVAGKGGDKIQITETYVKNGDRIFRVDGRRITKKYHIEPQILNREITVPAGHIFVVGQTDYSWDSRFWGTIPETTITGKAYAIF